MHVTDALNERIAVGDIIVERNNYGKIRPYLVTGGRIMLASIELDGVNDNNVEHTFQGRQYFENLIVVTPQYMANNDIQWVKDAEQNFIHRYTLEDKRPQNPVDVTLPLGRFLDKCLTQEFAESSTWGMNANGHYGYTPTPVLRNNKKIIQKTSNLTIGDEKVNFDIEVSVPAPIPTDLDDLRDWKNGHSVYVYMKLKIDYCSMSYHSNGKITFENPLIIDGVNVMEDDTVRDYIQKLVERCENS